MHILRTASLSSVLALTASGAFALTPEQVWEDLSELLSAGGAEVSVETESRDGDTLRIEGIEITATVSETEETATTTIPEMIFVAQSDGSVAVTLPPEMTTSTVTTVEGETVEFDMVIAHDGFEMLVSGEDTAERYAFSGNSMSLRTPAPMQIEDSDGAKLEMDFDVTMNGIDGAYDVSVDDLQRFDTNTTIQSVEIDFGGVTSPATDGDPEESFRLDATLTNVSSEGNAAVPEFEAGAPIGTMIADGFEFASMITFENSGYTFTADGSGGQFTYGAESQSSELSIDLGESGIRYAGGSRNITNTISGDAIPLPEIVLTMAESAFDFSAPLAPGDAPQDFGLLLSVVDLVVPDTVWSMFDPQGVLPRDPATLVIDVDGTATVAQDFTDPAVAESGTPMGELNTVTVSDLQLSLAGADLSGEGDFTFTTDAQGIPQPVGAATLTLVGGNTLLDALVQMGLLPQEQAMGARMMIGLFARPGQGDDTLVSEIEIQADGAVLANGQRIR